MSSLVLTINTKGFRASILNLNLNRGAAGGGDDEEDQERMEAIADNLQTRDAVRLYNWVSHRCFSDCVTTFYRRALGKKEEDCVRKFLLISAARFAHLASSSATAFDD